MKTLTESSTQPDYEAVYNQPPGTIIRLRGEYEKLAFRLLILYAPENTGLLIMDILPGTQLYTEYGVGHMVIVNPATT